MRLFFCIIALFFSTITIAEQKIETIQLNHRLAIEVLPEIQAFLPTKATARAYDEFIIIKADSKIIHSIEQLINKLDTPSQRLRISVLKTDKNLSNQQGNQLSANIAINDDERNSDLSIQHWSTQSARNKDHSYQVQGIAGKPVLIMLGQDIPQKEQYLILRNDGDLAIQSNTSYIKLNNGFQAIARILPNNQVIIDIHPAFSNLNPHTGSINNSNIISTISGPASTWLELGHVDNEKNIEKRGISSYHSHHQLQQTIYIKVDLL